MATFSIDVSFAAQTANGGCGLGVRGEVTRNGDNWLADNQNVGTAAELVTVGDVSSGTSFFYLRNGGSTVIVLYSDGATGAKEIGRLAAGKAACGFVANGFALGAKALVSGSVLEKLFIENVGLIEGSLALYTPSTPTAGTSVETVIISATIGGSTVNIANTVSESIAACGYLSNWSASESGYTDLWPDTNLTGGTGYGTVMILNQSATDTGFLAEAAGTTTFGDLIPFNGFLLMPTDSAAVTSGVQGDGSAITVASIATRKTL